MRFATFVSTAAALVSLTRAISLDVSLNLGDVSPDVASLLANVPEGVTDKTVGFLANLIPSLGVVSDVANTCGTELPCMLAKAADPNDPTVDPASLIPTGTSDANPSIIPRSWTNAQRFARGLPPKPPHRRSAARRQAAAPQPSGSPPQNLRGHIQVNRADTGDLVGYVAASTIGKYAYKIQQANDDTALIVSVDMPAGATSGTELNLKTENSDVTGFEYWGAVQGRDDVSADFSKGSYQYGYLSSTNPTDALAAPQSVGNAYTTASGLPRTSESAIWSLDTTTGALAPHWINSDNTAPAVDVFSQSTALYIGGDADAFVARYPSPVVKLTLKFVAI